MTPQDIRSNQDIITVCRILVDSYPKDAQALKDNEAGMALTRKLIESGRIAPDAQDDELRAMDRFLVVDGRESCQRWFDLQVAMLDKALPQIPDVAAKLRVLKRGPVRLERQDIDVEAWQQDLDAIAAWIGALPEKGSTPAATAGGKGKRKRRQSQKRELTPKQLEAFHAYGECQANHSATARKLGISINAAKDRIKAACKKLGQSVPKKTIATKPLPQDRRGNVNLVHADDRRKD
jgi:hypothetical protein